jgi:hypothetical protein
VTNAAEELQKLGGAHAILATAPNSKAMSELIDGLAPSGKFIVVGISADPIAVTPLQLISGERAIQRSAVGTPTDSEDTMNRGQPVLVARVAGQARSAVATKLASRAREPSHGLSFSAHYTFSKMIDDNSVSAGNLTWLGGNATVQSVRNLRLERSVSTWDLTHRAVADLSWQLPIGKGKQLGTSWKGWLDHLLGQWQVNGIATRQSGFPLVPALSGSVLVDSNQRPNLIGDPNLSGRAQDKLDMFVNPAAFSRPDAYKFGTAARTLPWARGPGTSNLDLSLFRRRPQRINLRHRDLTARASLGGQRDVISSCDRRKRRRISEERYETV